ncbi:MAG: hypothetical protein H0W15_10980 [Gemmatimonadales bacterium]|nr:hypothetical protein [Gemmatimonadales bacterium]
MPALATVALRDLLARRFPDAVPLPERREQGVGTGVALLDRILPGGGLPRGRPTLWEQPGAAATALLAAACQSVIAQGMRTAWIDGDHSLGHGWRDGPLMLRPRTPLLGLRFAEVLLACGGFALVVVSGVTTDRTTMFRLGRAVHEGGGAFAMLGEGSLPAALKLRSHYLLDRMAFAMSPFGEPAAINSVHVSIEASASGWRERAVLTLPFAGHVVRSALEAGLVDRRGVKG